MSPKRKTASHRKGPAAKETVLNNCQHYTSKRDKSQDVSIPKHSHIRQIFASVYDESHGNYILTPIGCRCCGNYRGGKHV